MAHAIVQRRLCCNRISDRGPFTWSAFSAALTAGEVLSRNFVGDEQTEAELLRRVNADPLSPGVFAAISDGWATTPLMGALKANLREGIRLPVVMHFKLVTEDRSNSSPGSSLGVRNASATR